MITIATKLACTKILQNFLTHPCMNYSGIWFADFIILINYFGSLYDYYQTRININYNYQFINIIPGFWFVSIFLLKHFFDHLILYLLEWTIWWESTQRPSMKNVPKETVLLLLLQPVWAQATRSCWPMKPTKGSLHLKKREKKVKKREKKTAAK